MRCLNRSTAFASLLFLGVGGLSQTAFADSLFNCLRDKQVTGVNGLLDNNESYVSATNCLANEGAVTSPSLSTASLATPALEFTSESSDDQTVTARIGLTSDLE